MSKYANKATLGRDTTRGSVTVTYTPSLSAPQLSGSSATPGVTLSDGGHDEVAGAGEGLLGLSGSAQLRGVLLQSFQAAFGYTKLNCYRIRRQPMFRVAKCQHFIDESLFISLFNVLAWGLSSLMSPTTALHLESPMEVKIFPFNAGKKDCRAVPRSTHVKLQNTEDEVLCLFQIVKGLHLGTVIITGNESLTIARQRVILNILGWNCSHAPRFAEIQIIQIDLIRMSWANVVALIAT